ncbi:MAG: hypothetical protein CBD63_01650 [Candidatus Pelagibacter sp. TMED203]|nr:MAG: hypothetical protein CBD63_01650 [Candidatus Pelagibacter sp. TMED203]
MHGHSASFLMLDSKWMTLNYLHPNADKVGMRNAAKANGDTHIYLYTRNGGDNGGGFNLSSISPQPDWEARLDELNNMGLKPVLWLTPDDSPSIVNQSLDAQKAHFSNMVARFDSRVTGYVTCLECDEYWSAAQVQALVAHLKSQTTKPVGVHMTPHFKAEYFANADYVFLQTGFNKTPEQVKAMVAHAIAVTGKPVVASEYHLESRSATARALGDAACAAGAIGTGNGRSIMYCGAEETPKKKNNDSDMAMAVVGLAFVAFGAYYLHTNYDFELKFDLTDNYQTYGTKKTFNLFEKDDNSLNFEMDFSHTTADDVVSNKVLFALTGTF